MTLRVSLSRTGRALSTASARPPARAKSLPSCTVGMEPNTGASINCAPFSSTIGSSARPVIGCRVLISMNSFPATSPRRKPSSPANSRRTPASSVMIDMTKSLRSATARALSTVRKPLAVSARWAASSMSHPTTSTPCAAKRCAIALPIRPRPTMPTFMRFPTILIATTTVRPPQPIRVRWRHPLRRKRRACRG